VNSPRLRHVFDERHDRRHVRANGNSSADIGLLREMNGSFTYRGSDLSPCPTLVQLNATDLLGRNLEIVFLVFTELERIAAQNQRAGKATPEP